jgi:hypothetical protein
MITIGILVGTGGLSVHASGTQQRGLSIRIAPVSSSRPPTHITPKTKVWNNTNSGISGPWRIRRQIESDRFGFSSANAILVSSSPSAPIFGFSIKENSPAQPFCDQTLSWQN